MPTRYSVARAAIDEAISRSVNMDEFKHELKLLDYSYQFNPNRKYWTVTPPGWTKPIRVHRLGAEYTADRIQERVYANDTLRIKAIRRSENRLLRLTKTAATSRSRFLSIRPKQDRRLRRFRRRSGGWSRITCGWLRRLNRFGGWRISRISFMISAAVVRSVLAPTAFARFRTGWRRRSWTMSASGASGSRPRKASGPRRRVQFHKRGKPNLDGAKDGNLANFDLVRTIAKETDMFVEVGGGIRDEERIVKYLDAGVSRVILGTVAAENPVFVKEMTQKYRRLEMCSRQGDIFSRILRKGCR